MTSIVRKIMIAAFLLRYSVNSFAQISGDHYACLRPGAPVTVLQKERDSIKAGELMASAIGVKRFASRPVELSASRVVCTSAENAGFTLSGTPYLAFSVSLPSLYTFYGPHPFSVRLYLSLPPGLFVPGATGIQAAFLKAALNVTTQTPASYTGEAEIPVTINYN